MVLQSKRVNLENAPPSLRNSGSVKSLGARVRSSIHDPNRQRRARVAHSSKYATDQAKRRSKKTVPAPVLNFDVTSVDVEMRDVVETQPALSKKRYQLPRELPRPAFQDISTETLVAFEPELLAEDQELPAIEYIMDFMTSIGPGLLRVAAGVVADPPKDGLPREIAITLNDPSTYPPPTHMLAIHTSPPKDGPSNGPSNVPRAVTLVPVHSAVLALYCARLPAFPEKNPSPAYISDDRTQLMVPVQPFCIPAPATWPKLASFLYTKRADILLKSLLPCPPPPALENDRTLVPGFATRLATTYTSQALLLHVNTVHGLWKNVVALGVFVDELWDTIDLAWEVLLTAMAISAGTPYLMLKRPSSPPPPVASTSEGVAPTAAQVSTADPDSRAATPTP
ncbi:hypothetical protein DFH09DRAFT_196124 [Mycena vulgaris]|nr:hypothetical protein DFH09DRAFT_196124 [Mycena vulgaris]